MEEIFTIKNIIIYLLTINLVSFMLMYIDKRKAKKERIRIPEKTLFLAVFLGGGIGGIAGMYAFRHKTKKVKFVIGFPLILIFEVLVAVVMFLEFK